MTSATFSVARMAAFDRQRQTPEYDPEYREFETAFMNAALRSGVVPRLMVHVANLLPSSPERWWIARKAHRIRAVNESVRSLTRSVRALFE